jgi:hypothetical protein
LRAAGHDVTVVPADSDLLSVALGTVRYPRDADVLVFQRISHRVMAEAVGWLAERVAVVMDVDDDLAAVDPANPAFRLLHPRNEQHTEHSWRWVEQACRAATLVTVSTPALLPRYAAHGRGVVLPNCVPARYLDVPHVDSGVVGWPASLASHPADPAPARPAIARLVREGVQFRIIGDPAGCGAAFGLPADPPGTGNVPFDQWPEHVARLGIAIAPLLPTRFNRGKSDLKGREAASVGVPWVGSAGSPEYRRLHAQGCGRLASSGRDWYRELRRLVDDPEWRAELSAAGRRVAAAQTIEEHAGRWLAAWQRAAELRAPRPAPQLDPTAAALLRRALVGRRSAADLARPARTRERPPGGRPGGRTLGRG